MSRIKMLVVAALVVLSGCTFTRNLDTAELEAEIERGIAAQTGAQGVTVDCPEDVPLEAGNTFTCDAADATGQTVTVNVTQEDDEGNVRWEVAG